MIKVRKYIEGEVIETDIMGTNSRAVTHVIKDVIGNTIARAGTQSETYVVNNLHLKDYIDTGILYKNLSARVELAKMGAREIQMPMLGNTRKRLKVITPPLYIAIDKRNVTIGIHTPNQTPFNPYTNVFYDTARRQYTDVNGRVCSFNLPRVCLGGEIDMKLDRNFPTGNYKALDVLIDWLVSSPNHDLPLVREFRMGRFREYIESAIFNGRITKDDIANIKDIYEEISNEISDDNSQTKEYDEMLALHSAISQVTPQIASEFILRSYVEDSNREYSYCKSSVLSFFNSIIG